MPKVDYPAFFDGGLVGGRINSPIQYREAFLKVPYKCMMTVERAHNDPALAQFYKENP
jgi:hypothetical protein